MRQKTLILLFLICVLSLTFGCGGTDSDSDPSTSPGQDGDDDDAVDPADDDDDDTAVDDDDSAYDDDDSPLPLPEIVFPPYPFWDNDAFAINEQKIATLAAEYCEEKGADADSADFFYHALPQAAFAALHDGVDGELAKTYMGDLYLSGFFGGVWLVSVLHPGIDKDAGPFDRLDWLFDGIAGIVAGQMTLVYGGTDGEIVTGAGKHARLMTPLYGYNRGYVEQVLASPPDGVQAPQGVLECGTRTVFDCRAPIFEPTFASDYDGVLDALIVPTNPRWEEMAAVAEKAERSVNVGSFIWDYLPLSNLTEEAYFQLIDLSLSFLMISKVSALGNMAAYSDAVPETGRRTLAVDTGMMAWAGSYFLGLRGGYISDEVPELICP